MKQLNISELRNKVLVKQRRRAAVYDEVLKKCHFRIQRAATNEKYECSYEVPQYVVGLPLYSMQECIDHIKEQLSQNGFTVTYVFPVTLKITWFPPKEEKPREDEGPSTYAIGYKNERGKFVLRVD